MRDAEVDWEADEVRELPCADRRRNANGAAAADLKVDGPIQAHAFGIYLELSVSRVGLAAQPNVKSICAFGKVAAKLIMAELCLNRS